jgi:thioredoxin-like negative regulator of GroEL
MKPVVDGLAQQYKGKVEFRRLDANDDATQQLAQAYGVQYVPTFVFLNADGTRSDQLVGEASAADLTKRLDALK